jgi:hypothetical protein
VLFSSIFELFSSVFLFVSFVAFIPTPFVLHHNSKMQPSQLLRPILLFLVLGFAYLVASTVVLSTDSWADGPSKPKGIVIRINKSIRKSRSVSDHWGSDPWSNPWANPWPNPWDSSWSSGSGGKFSKEIVISKSGGGSSWKEPPAWPPAEGWSAPKSSWPPSDGWKSGKEISLSIGGSDSWEPPSWPPSWPSSWPASSSNSWSNPWNSWDSWKSTPRIKIKPEAQEVHSGDALIREHRNSNLGINGYVQFLQYVRPKRCGHCGWPSQ